MKFRIIIAISISFILASCSCAYHAKRAQVKCGPLKEADSIISNTSISDSVRIREKVRIDTAFITVQGPTQYLPNPCQLLCDSLGRVKPLIRTEVKNGIRSSIHTEGQDLVVDCDADSLKAVIQSKDMEIEHIRREKETDKKSKTIEIPVYVKSWWNKFTNWFFWIMMVLITGFIGFKYLKKRLTLSH